MAPAKSFVFWTIGAVCAHVRVENTVRCEPMRHGHVRNAAHLSALPPVKRSLHLRLAKGERQEAYWPMTQRNRLQVRGDCDASFSRDDQAGPRTPAVPRTLAPGTLMCFQLPLRVVYQQEALLIADAGRRSEVPGCV